MARWLLVAIAIATAALGFSLWRSLGEPAEVAAEAPAKTAKRPTKKAPSTSKVRAAIASPRPEDAADDPVDRAPAKPKPTEKEIEIEAIGRFRSGPVVQELYAQAATCYRGEEGRSEKMTVRYHLRVEDGNASIVSASLVSSDIGSRRLEDCIIRAIKNHSWPVADGFEVDESNEGASFSILGLQKRVRMQQAADD